MKEITKSRRTVDCLDSGQMMTLVTAVGNTKGRSRLGEGNNEVDLR